MCGLLNNHISQSIINDFIQFHGFIKYVSISLHIRNNNKNLYSLLSFHIFWKINNDYMKYYELYDDPLIILYSVRSAKI